MTNGNDRRSRNVLSPMVPCFTDASSFLFVERILHHSSKYARILFVSPAEKMIFLRTFFVGYTSALLSFCSLGNKEGTTSLYECPPLSKFIPQSPSPNCTKTNSYTGKIIAFTGKALQSVTPSPRNIYLHPCSCTISLATVHMPLFK